MKIAAFVSRRLILRCVLAVIVASNLCVAAEPSKTPPDLTPDRAVDRELTYNLGATGLRGWIHTKPATHFDGLQGRTTAASRQILVTHVGAKSPAEGVLQVEDVILGVGGQPFSTAGFRRRGERAASEAISNPTSVRLGNFRA